MNALIGPKPMFSQSIKHSISVFYCFARVNSVYHKANEETYAVYYI